MKAIPTLILMAFLLVPAAVLAEGPEDAASRVEDLRAQLQDVQWKEAELQARLKQLEEDMKPQNIQNSLAGVGSTRPEELRELRRKQLEAEKAGVQAQLSILATSRARLEAAIVQAEAAAYHQSARGAGSPVEQVLMSPLGGSPRWLVTGVAVAIGVLMLAVLFIVIRKQRRA